MKILKSTGPSTEPCGTLDSIEVEGHVRRKMLRIEQTLVTQRHRMAT